MTLARAALGEQTLLKQALMVLGGTFLIALAAQISVPMYPTPVTLQTLAVLLIGLAFGARLGVVTVLTYLAQGAAGLPVFASATNGIAFFGPTAGFLFGFVLMVWIVGVAADRGWARHVVGASIAAIIASACLYVPGAAWPMAIAGAFGLEAGWVGLSSDKIWAGFIAPFVLGDLVKSVLAAVIVTGAAAWLSRREA